MFRRCANSQVEIYEQPQILHSLSKVRPQPTQMATCVQGLACSKPIDDLENTVGMSWGDLFILTQTVVRCE